MTSRSSSPAAPDTVLIDALRSALHDAADPERGPVMQAYMKSEMPFLGIGANDRRSVVKEILAAHESMAPESWAATVSALWEGADYREERYAALDLLENRTYRDALTTERLPLLEQLIVNGAWWDYVDRIAAHPLGTILARDPEPTAAQMRAWALGANPWKRRSAILCQLRRGARTDRKLLYDCIRPSMNEPDFFLRKAIGWALRQYARSEPEEVARFVSAHAHELSPLSRREALKHIHPPNKRGKSNTP